MTETLDATERTRLRRSYKRGHFDLSTIHAILDAQPMCSVGYVIDGKPYVTPTLQWREGDTIYWHGSSASRAIRAQNSTDVCVSVAILDGFVMARSGFNHSVNSRSVTLFGTAFKVEDPQQKREKLSRFIDGLFPGRSVILRRDLDQDIKATTLLGLKIDEASAKVRSGPPEDEDEDCALPIWAGEIPVRMTVGEPIADERNLEGIEVPDHIRDFKFE